MSLNSMRVRRREAFKIKSHLSEIFCLTGSAGWRLGKGKHFSRVSHGLLMLGLCVHGSAKQWLSCLGLSRQTPNPRMSGIASP